MPILPLTTLAVILGAGLLTAACSTRNGASSSATTTTTTTTTPAAGGAPSPVTVTPFACDSTAGVLDGGVSLAGRAGRYLLALHATTGPRRGGTTHGLLALVPSSRAARGNVAYPLEGSATLDAAMVGGMTAGSTESRDPAAPGVLVLEYPRAGDASPARDITIRLGRDANAATLTGDRFDGAYMALYVQSVTDRGFTGRWTSGLEGSSAGGYFCAIRR